MKTLFKTAVQGPAFGLALLLGAFLPAEMPPRAGLQGRSMQEALAQEVDWWALPAFQDILARHDRFLPELARMRRQAASHAPELARLLAALPGSDGLNAAHIERILAKPEPSGARGGGVVFEPWAGRWAGSWSNGRQQFHSWGPAMLLEGRWVQPVTLSESEFVEPNCAQDMMALRRSDIAINVNSPQHGITGWVSKVQDGRVEMPHIGYQLNDTTLIWLCQAKYPGREQEPGRGDWLVFLETIVQPQGQAAYRIHGLKFRFGEEGAIQAAPENHSGLYRPATEGTRRGEAW